MTAGGGGLVDGLKAWFEATQPRFDQCGVETEYNEVFDDRGGATPMSATLWAFGPVRSGRVSVWDLVDAGVDGCADVEVLDNESQDRVVDTRRDYEHGEPKILDLKQFIALIAESNEAG